MAKQTRRQHTVSKFYLRGFADKGKTVRRIELPGDKEVLISVTSASVIKDFYSLELPDGASTDYFEQLFGGVEAAAADAFAAIEGGTWPLEGARRLALASWIALQHLRGEREREFMSHHAGEMIQMVVGISGKEALRSHIERAEGRIVGDNELAIEWADLTKPGGPTMRADKWQHIRIVLDLVPSMAAYLVDCHWTLVRFSRKTLVTSDHPVSMVVDDDYPAWSGVGIFTADLFAVPLTRRLALNIQPRRRLETYTSDPASVPDLDIPGTTSMANSFNQQAVRNARQYVFAHPEDQLDSRIVIPDRAQPRFSIDAASFVREEGYFAGVDTSAFADPLAAKGHSFGLADVPWPIPGRVRAV